MKNNETASNKVFEENYFKGWFKNAVGNFSQSDLEYSKKWFWSWLKILEKDVPLDLNIKKRVLEIGCSIGGFSTLLWEKNCEVWASDISSYAIQRARKLNSSIHYRELDVQKRISIPGLFDYIFAFEVTEHLKYPEKAIRNIYRKLKQNGVFIFSTPYPYPWIYSDPTHINVKYPDEWTKIAHTAGFNNIVIKKYCLIPYFYRLNKHFQFPLPFHIKNKYINNLIFFIAYKNE